VAEQTGLPGANRYQQEAETFVGIMQEMAPSLQLDYSRASIVVLEEWIGQTFDPPGTNYVGPRLPVGIGCYLGETIRRTLGGSWSKDGTPELGGMGEVKSVFPIDRVLKRFERGPEESLLFYYDTIARYARASGRRARGS
jgi:hypothetical protein